MSDQGNNWQASNGSSPPPVSSNGLTGVIIRILGLFAVVLFISSTLPSGLVAASIQQLLMLGVVLATAVAVMRRQRPLDPNLTAWDEAAVLLFLAMAAGFFVDPAAVEQALIGLQLGNE